MALPKYCLLGLNNLSFPLLFMNTQTMPKHTFNPNAEFEYLGFTLKPVKMLTEKERDDIFKTVNSIGVSNYTEMPLSSHRSMEYSYDAFYAAAKAADANAEVFLFDDKGLVVPGQNELFAINKEEANKINIKKKLYKTVIQVEILSEEPYKGEELDTIHNDITFGHCSGIARDVSRNQELEGRAAAEEVKRHGTTLEFFQMNEAGFVQED